MAQIGLGMKKQKRAIISLSFDDGRVDTYTVAKEVLVKYNVPATINIATGYIEGETNVGTDIVSMTKENVIELDSVGLFEIAAHGDMHKNDFDDIAKGREKLLSWLGREGKIGFASPSSVMTVAYINENQEKLKKIGFSYARTSSTHQKKRFVKIKKILRKVARVTGSRILYRMAYSDLSTVDGFAVTSVPIFKFNTFGQIKSIIRLAIRRRAQLTLMFHSVCKTGDVGSENIYSYNWDEFVKLVKYISTLNNNGKIRILTTQQLVNSGVENDQNRR